VLNKDVRRDHDGRHGKNARKCVTFHILVPVFARLRRLGPNYSGRRRT
jgi:hypothetical protein